MSLHNMHLRKLLKIIYLDGRSRTSALRADIREEIGRELGGTEGGGDFYGPFWRDAKDHVFGAADLTEQTRIRIESNAGRANLYQQLRDGFLVWWNDRRRWTNEPFQPANSMKTVCRVPDVDADIKIANILSVRDGREEDHFVYPYWFPEPTMSEEAGRLGLWTLCHAFPAVEPSQFRVLDVIRGQTFSLDRNPLDGHEQAVFSRRFNLALAEWERLRLEYD